MFTLTLFDSEGIDTLYDGAPIADVEHLTTETFRPRATTPLYDALGRTLAMTEQRIRALGWSSSILFVIITDGHENASREWSGERVFARVKELELAGWAFMYLGAHLGAYAAADSIGVAKGSQSQWHKSAAGAQEMGKSLARSAKGLRMKERVAHELIREEERKQMERPRAPKSAPSGGGYL